MSTGQSGVGRPVQVGAILHRGSRVHVFASPVSPVEAVRLADKAEGSIMVVTTKAGPPKEGR